MITVMADISNPSSTLQGGLWKHIRSAWAVIVVILITLAIFDPAQLWPSIEKTIEAFGQTLYFITFAVLAIGYLKASGAEALVAEAFKGNEMRMILFASALGGLAPFCSCEVIPFIAALLAAGAPLSAVMAFWLSSPLMDPAMFIITSGTLGFEFAIAKTIAAVGMGLLGGSGVMLFSKSALFTVPLRMEGTVGTCGCGSSFKGTPVWRFWTENKRLETFKKTTVENALFLGKWLLLAYLLESLMLVYVPAEWISSFLGDGSIGPVILGALVGAPAYLNGYAAVPLVDAMLTQGMSNGAAMSFMLAGGVSSIPAAIAVWALVKPRVFAGYLGFAFAGSVAAGLIWNTLV